MDWFTKVSQYAGVYFYVWQNTFIYTYYKILVNKRKNKSKIMLWGKKICINNG